MGSKADFADLVRPELVSDDFVKIDLNKPTTATCLAVKVEQPLKAILNSTYIRIHELVLPHQAHLKQNRYDKTWHMVAVAVHQELDDGAENIQKAGKGIMTDLRAEGLLNKDAMTILVNYKSKAGRMKRLEADLLVYQFTFGPDLQATSEESMLCTHLLAVTAGQA